MKCKPTGRPPAIPETRRKEFEDMAPHLSDVEMAARFKCSVTTITAYRKMWRVVPDAEGAL